MRFTIKGRLLLLCAILAGLLLAVGGLGLHGMNSMERATGEIYEERLVPTRQLGRLNALMRDNQMLLGMLSSHDPRLEESSRLENNTQSYLERMSNNSLEINELLDNYLASSLREAERELAETFFELRAVYLDGLNQAAALYEQGEYREANLALYHTVTPQFYAANEPMLELVQLQDQAADELFTQAQATGTMSRKLGLGAMLIALFVASTLGWWIIRSIDRPLKRMMNVFNRMAEGKLDNRILIDSHDEIGQTLQLLDKMQTQLRQLILSIQQSADSIATGAGQISAGNTDLSQRTEEQAASLQETATSMEQVASSVSANTESTAKANELVYGAQRAATLGGEKTRLVVGKMQELNESSQQVQGIISVIDSISFQTNILALNASVEAARAGEQGRGFAVVAQEVRKLAQRSADAAKEIQQLIGKNADIVHEGGQYVDETGAAMQEILDQVERVSLLMEEVTRGSEQQTAAVGQVSIAVNQMDEVTQQNAALVEQTANASASLEQQAQELQHAVEFFDVGQTMETAPPKALPQDPKPERQSSTNQRQINRNTSEPVWEAF